MAVGALGAGGAAGRCGPICTTTSASACSPSSTPRPTRWAPGYHIIQSKIALGSGRPLGPGLPARHPGASSASCPRSRPTSPSPCWPRSWASSARRRCWPVPGRHPAGPGRSPCARPASSRRLLAVGVVHQPVHLRRDQRLDGDRPDPGRRRAAAADLLRRHRDADPGRSASACCSASTSTATLTIPRFPVEL